MERRQFQGYNCDLIELQESIEKYFVGKEYRVTNFHKNKVYLSQVYKDEMGNSAVFAKIEGVPAKFVVSIGFSQRIRTIKKATKTFDKIPFQTKILLREPMLEKNFWNYVTTQADLKRNTYGLAKIFASELPQIWREREIVREIEILYCRYCGAKNNARSTSCTQCGGNLR